MSHPGSSHEVANPHEPTPEEVPPPFLGAWPRVYVVVVLSQVVFVIVLAVLAELAS